MSGPAQSNLLVSNKLTTLDFSNQTLYKLSFEKFPNLEYNVFQVVLPGLTFGETVQPTPIRDLPLPGDKLTYDPVVISFLVQEDFENYFEIARWIYGLAKPITTEQRRRLEQQKARYSDAILSILSNKRNVVFNFKFVNCFPLSLSSLTLDASASDAAPLTADVTLQFQWMETEKIEVPS